MLSNGGFVAYLLDARTRFEKLAGFFGFARSLRRGIHIVILRHLNRNDPNPTLREFAGV